MLNSAGPGHFLRRKDKEHQRHGLDGFKAIVATL